MLYIMLIMVWQPFIREVRLKFSLSFAVTNVDNVHAVSLATTANAEGSQPHQPMCCSAASRVRIEVLLT